MRLTSARPRPRPVFEDAPRVKGAKSDGPSSGFGAAAAIEHLEADLACLAPHQSRASSDLFAHALSMNLFLTL